MSDDERIQPPKELSSLQLLYWQQCYDVVRGGRSRPLPSRTLLMKLLPEWEALALKGLPLEVDCSRHSCGDDGAAALFDTLRLAEVPLHITGVLMPQNDLRNQAVEALCRLLRSKNGASITRLDLKYNPFIGIEAAQNLIAALAPPSGDEESDARPSRRSVKVELEGTNVPPHFLRRLSAL